MGNKLANKVLLIGWDAADWKLIRPLMKDGHMPTLQRFVKEGSWGNCATLNPILSPMLWTSIGTGKRPTKHGIHGFIEPMPDGKGIRPSSSTTRKCKAIWNILSQKGYDSHAVGRFCSHPAEPINGVCVSNMYDRVTSADPAKWDLPDGAVHPAELADTLADTLADLRVHPTELVAEQILPFIPNAAKIDQDKDRRLSIFAKLLCEMVNIHSAATWIMETQPWDFMAVYNPAIDHFCHAFMQYHTPKMDRVREEDFDIYKDVVNGCYRFHDMMLQRLLHLAGDDAAVVICSDHGFHSDHLRPRSTPREPAGPAVWHREYGVVAMKGPGIKQGERVYGATVLDITPTVLSLFGLPTGSDMDGKPLVSALEGLNGSVWPQRIESWDAVDGDAGMHPTDKREDPFEARESIQQLVQLGYIDAPDENAERAAAQATRESQYNLGRAYLDAGQADDAINLLEGLVSNEPEQLRFGLCLAQCYLADRRWADARRQIEDVLDRAQKQAGQAADMLDKRRQQLQERAAEHETAEEPDDSERTEGQDQRQVPRLTPEMVERAERVMAARQRWLRGLDVRVTPRARFMLGVLDLHERKFEDALVHLEEAEKAEPRLPGLHIQIGRAYLRMKRWEDAYRAYRKAIEIDGDSALAHEGVAAALLRLGRPTGAAEHALIAVGLLHHFPRAHLRLGVALMRLRMYERAVEAFETCVKIAPRSVAAHRRLASIYTKRLNRPDLAAEHLSKATFNQNLRSTRPTT